MKEVFGNKISDIPGIGPSKEQQLKDAGFDTLEKLSNATPEEIHENCHIKVKAAISYIKEAERLLNPKSYAQLERDIEKLQKEVGSLHDWNLKLSDRIFDLQCLAIANASRSTVLDAFVSKDSLIFYDSPDETTCYLCSSKIHQGEPVYETHFVNRSDLREKEDDPRITTNYYHRDCVMNVWRKFGMND